jgi:hypothetical protein
VKRTLAAGQKFFSSCSSKTMSDENVAQAPAPAPPADRYNTDALSIGPGQRALCECCKTIFNTSEKQMFFAFPPGIVGNIVEQAIPLCCDCIHRIRWKEPSEKENEETPVEALKCLNCKKEPPYLDGYCEECDALLNQAYSCC